MSAFASVATGVRDPEFMVPKMAMGSAQIAEQAGTPQAVQKVDSSLTPTSGDATVGNF